MIEELLASRFINCVDFAAHWTRRRGAYKLCQRDERRPLQIPDKPSRVLENRYLLRQRTGRAVDRFRHDLRARRPHADGRNKFICLSNRRHRRLHNKREETIATRACMARCVQARRVNRVSDDQAGFVSGKHESGPHSRVLSGPGYPEYGSTNIILMMTASSVMNEKAQGSGQGSFSPILKLTRSDGILRGVRDIKVERCSRNCTGR